MLYALRMLIAIIGAKNQIWSDSAAVWQAIVTLFITNGPIMMETIEKAWYYISRSLAPLLWINLLSLSLSYWRDKDNDTDARSRREKRAESQHRKRYNAKRGRMRQGSIRDYNLHSSYPLCLCQQGLFRGRPPNVSQRMNAEVTQNVATAGQQVTNTVRNNGRNPIGAGQEGGGARNRMDRCSCTRTRAIDVVAPALRAIIQPQRIHLLKGTTIGLNNSIKPSERLWYM